jgi:hypothetical protein
VTPEPQPSPIKKRKRKRKNKVNTQIEPVTEAADVFLERLKLATITDEDILSYIDLPRVENSPLSSRHEKGRRAWEMCISFARHSSQQLKYGRFLLFLSLCFFLIWERYSHKQGKSAAREAGQSPESHMKPQTYRPTDQRKDA